MITDAELHAFWERVYLGEQVASADLRRLLLEVKRLRQIVALADGLTDSMVEFGVEMPHAWGGPVISNERLVELLARASAAEPADVWFDEGPTPGEVRRGERKPGERFPVYPLPADEKQHMANLLFAAHSRADVPELVEEVKRLRAAIEGMAEVSEEAIADAMRDTIDEICSTMRASIPDDAPDFFRAGVLKIIAEVERLKDAVDDVAGVS